MLPVVASLKVSITNYHSLYDASSFVLCTKLVTTATRCFAVELFTLLLTQQQNRMFLPKAHSFAHINTCNCQKCLNKPLWTGADGR